MALMLCFVRGLASRSDYSWRRVFRPVVTRVLRLGRGGGCDSPGVDNHLDHPSTQGHARTRGIMNSSLQSGDVSSRPWCDATRPLDTHREQPGQSEGSNPPPHSGYHEASMSTGRKALHLLVNIRRSVSIQRCRVFHDLSRLARCCPLVFCGRGHCSSVHVLCPSAAGHLGLHLYCWAEIQ